MTDHDNTHDADREWLVNQVAHALRNPIFAATVQTEALRLRMNDPQAMAKTIDNLHGQLMRLSSNIDEMLLFGRPIRGTLEEISVNEILGALATRYGNGDRQDPAEIYAPENDPDLTGHWDRNAVVIILERLLDNAVQHTDEPHSISLGAVPGPNQTVVFTVEDRGHGIPAEILEKAELPFFPQHSGRAGLGLAVADKFARFLGGRIEIESIVGEGTTARCVLPLRADLNLPAPE